MSAGLAQVDGSIASRVAERFAVDGFSTATVELPADSPEAFTTSVETPEGVWTLYLTKHSLRGDAFRVGVHRDGGVLDYVDAPPVATYRGTVAELPGSVVAAGLVHTGGGDGAVHNGVVAAIFPADGPTWFVRPLGEVDAAASPGAHVVYSQDDRQIASDICGTDSLDGPMGKPEGGDADGGVSPRDNCLKRAQIAFDSDHEFYVAHGETAGSVAMIEASLNVTDMVFARDVGITYELTTVFVWETEADPWEGDDANPILTTFREYWNANHGDVVRDLAHIVIEKPAYDGIGGVAWVGAVCNQAWAYGLTRWADANILTHEIGHNWNAPHCLDPVCNSMCGGCLNFGPRTADVITAYRDSVGCLEDVGPYATPLEPRAFEDGYTILDGSPTLMDVLANDVDGNCDSFTLGSFDAVSSLGGTVERSVGTGPGGRDELLYTPPTAYSGPDTFTYTALDSTGLEGVGTVTVQLPKVTPSLVAHYRLDEPAGSTVMVDDSGFGRDGVYDGNVILEAAPLASGTCVRFDDGGTSGSLGRAIVSGASLPTMQSLSLSFWIQLNSNDTGGAVVMSKNTAGINDPWSVAIPAATTKVEWIVGGNPNNHQIADFITYNEPHHVVITHLDTNGPSGKAARARMYFDGALVDEKVDPRGFVDTSAADLRIGDRLADGMGMHGRLDDIQIYDNELSASEAAWLYANPGQTLSEAMGPGGVGSPGSSIDVWLDASRIAGVADGEPVATWSDASGSGHDGSQSGAAKQGTFVVAAQNGLPAVRFDGGDYYATDYRNSGRELTFVVVAHGNTGADADYQSIVRMQDDAGYVVYPYAATGIQNGFIVGPDDGTTGIRHGFDNGAWNIGAASYVSDYANGWRTNQNGRLVARRDSQDIFLPGAQTFIGANAYDTPGEFCNADVAEVILYNVRLNIAERRIVENALSAKWNIPLTSHDFYAGDDAAKGDFDFGVVGIGVSSDGDHSLAKGDGLVLGDADFLVDEDYVLVGHDGQAADDTTDDLPAGVSERWGRVWYVDVTDTGDDGGQVRLEFDFSDAGRTDAPTGDYSLLYRAGTSGEFAVIATSDVVSDDRVDFDNLEIGVDLIDGYITLGLAGACGPACEGADLDGDCQVNLTDLGLLLGNYGSAGVGIPGDVNDDGVVDLTDLGELLGHYGVDCQ